MMHSRWIQLPEIQKNIIVLVTLVDPLDEIFSKSFGLENEKYIFIVCFTYFDEPAKRYKIIKNLAIDSGKRKIGRVNRKTKSCIYKEVMRMV